MGHIFHRNIQQELPRAVKGDGVYIIDHQGKQYLDACGGAAVSCLGHSNSAILEAINTQIRELPYAHTRFFTTDVAEELAELLAKRTGGALDKVYFLCGGSEAIETAMKMARQYFVEIGEPERELFISRRQSYHGNTIASLSVGGNRWRRQIYTPILNRSHHISPCYAYRDQTHRESEKEYGLRVANELEQVIEQQGPNRVIAFIAETVVGATAGALTAVPGYFKRVREICDHYGVLLILDEIMCGMGRTGRYHAFEDEGIIPDMMTVGKGLGGGYQAMAATLVGQKIFEAIREGSGNFQHGHTYVGHPSGAACALAVQQYIDSHHLLGNVRTRSDELFSALGHRFSEHPNIGDIRGRGLFVGIELVEDRATKRPFSPGLKLDGAIRKVAMDNGLMVYPNAGTIDGKLGYHILLAPPFILESIHVEEMVDKLDKTVHAVLG